jgi:hypothetical protein
METIYFPSRSKVLVQRYLMPSILWLFAQTAAALIVFFRDGTPVEWSWKGSLFIGMVMMGMAGIEILWNFPWATRFAIRLTPGSFYGPLLVGRDEPIQFNEIDYERTLHTMRFGEPVPPTLVYSVHGDKMQIHASLFEEDDLAEIRRALALAEQKYGDSK